MTDTDAMDAFDIGFGPVVPTQSILTQGESPVEAYTSRRSFEAEREMFGKVWLNIAETAELPNPGDWIVRDVKIRSVSVIIVRGKDMKLRAFHNICSHRGMKLVWDDQGRGGKFSCPYHAWTYNAQGNLTNIPDEGCFPNVAKAESGLTPIACDTWEGFVFIHLEKEPPQSLSDFLGPVAEALRDAPFGEYPTRVRVRSTIAANWKLGVEAQSESYHASALHARTVAKMLATKANPSVHHLSWQPMGAHRSQGIPFNPDFTMPDKRLVHRFAFANAAPMVFGDGNTGQGSVSFSDQPGVNATRSNIWSNEQISIYPHFVLHVSMGGWFYHRFWPIDEATTLWEVYYHFRPVRSLRESFANQFSLAFNRDTLTEDNVAIEQQQPILASGAARVRFGEQEILCRHFAAVNDAVIRRFAPDAAALAAE